MVRDTKHVQKYVGTQRRAEDVLIDFHVLCLRVVDDRRGEGVIVGVAVKSFFVLGVNMTLDGMSEQYV